MQCACVPEVTSADRPARDVKLSLQETLPKRKVRVREVSVKLAYAISLRFTCELRRFCEKCGAKLLHFTKMRSNWRDCKAWEKEGLSLSTTSNEACKLYDAALTQFMGFYDDTSLGGLQTTLNKLREADPSFVLGRALSCGVSLLSMGQTTRVNTQLKQDLNEMVAMAAASKLTPREKSIVKAVDFIEKGQLDLSSEILEDVLLDHPNDPMALRFNNDLYLFRGLMTQLRDNWARCLPYWNVNTPLYDFYLSHLAFGYEETGMYHESEKMCAESLNMNRHVGWATHTLAHVYEMQCRTSEGIKFLSSTTDDWKVSNFLTGHNSWHWALYHYQHGEMEAALSVFDDRILPTISPNSMLSIYDAASLLYRMEMEGVKVGDRWKSLTEASRAHAEDHVNSFVDTQLLMAFIGNRDEEGKQKFLSSLKDYLRDGSGTFHTVLAGTGQALVDSLLAFERGEYAQVVEILQPVKYDIWKIGGSYAQRDLFNLILIQAALKSPQLRHRRYGRMLIAEWEAFRAKTPLSERLLMQAAAACEDD